MYVLIYVIFYLFFADIISIFYINRNYFIEEFVFLHTVMFWLQKLFFTKIQIVDIKYFSLFSYYMFKIYFIYVKRIIWFKILKSF